ncbi:TMAO reductase system periplasmic protein TorT [Aliiroseovarius sp. S1339]|uniref:TMAO reductase system periplasmic protein TorT n=1 Tax=Aliiroseovarius sp. S1339 TaxID=2936990 RepID=UPI0020BE7173|nr:TMAO reductase system periplasmic protein TorT [Aliiroseovarius sp. S1339]MCK8462800.1 TMAO reductase system periplasmic protein TorT [Aliiroseovarius sp. S1339]
MNVKTRSNCLSKPIRRMARRYGVLRSIAIAALGLFATGLFGVAPPAQAQSNAPSKAARICVVVPHFKDEYWLSVGFGLQQEAAKTGVKLMFFESGGYHALQRQVSLTQTCIAKGADAILLGAVSADAPDLLAAVETASASIPVLALVNEFHSPHLAAAIGVDWRDMGRAVGGFLATRHPPGTPKVRVGFVTGPTDSGWSPLLESGLLGSLRESSVDIVITRYADTGLREQLREVEDILAAEPHLDYLIGSAPAIEGAMGLAALSDAPFPKLIATYISHSVRRGLQSGKVLAVPFDDPVEHGHLGIRKALKAIGGEFSPRMAGPPIELVEAGDLDTLPLSPADLVLAIE